MDTTDLPQKLMAMRSGKRWWPAEIVLRGIGLLLLTGCWRLVLVLHQRATVPMPHPAGLADLGLCTADVLLLCSGLALTFAGPLLFRDVPLPPHFTRQIGTEPLPWSRTAHQSAERNLALDKLAHGSAKPQR